MEEDSRLNMSILLQFPKFSRGFRITDFDEFVQESIGVENLDFFGRLAYPNQWQIRLTDPETRERLIRTGRTRIKNRSCWMYPLNQQEIRGFVYWLPNSVTNDQLTEHLKLYGEVLFVESEERIVKDRRIQSDTRYYGLLLPHGTIKDDLPHFLKINGFLCLVVVRGRKPACFHCKEVGHRRAECLQYKAKLISYCCRDPNSAPPRLKARGRRHIQAETEIREETGSNDVSSTDDIPCLEKQVSINEETIEQHSLSELEDLEVITEILEEAVSSTERDLEENSVQFEDRAKTYLDSSAASLPETKIQTQDIFEMMQQIQRKTSEALQQSLQSFENEIVGTFTRGTLFAQKGDRSAETEAVDSRINLDQEVCNEELEQQTEEIWVPEEISTQVKISGEDFDVDTNIKETKGDGMEKALPTRRQDIITTIEEICKYPSEIAKDVETKESTAVDLVSVSDTRSVLLMLEKTKQTAVEILEGTFKKLAEFTKSNEVAEILSEDSAADTDKKLIKDEMHPHILMLKQAKQTATEYFGNTFKKLKEEITSLSFELAGDQTDKDVRLTKDDIQFAYQMLEQTKETVEETLESTFRRLENEIIKATEPDEMITEISPKSISPLKVSEDSRKSIAVLEQFKDVTDTGEYFSKEDMEIIVEDEDSKKQSSVDKSQEETIRTEYDISAALSEFFKAIKISKQSEVSEQVSVTEKTVTESKELAMKVSKAAQEGIYKLQTNIRMIFDSSLAEGKSELLSETKTIMKQIESEVNQMAEEMKSKVKTDIEAIFASFEADIFK
ncbi:uncharacterized protein LOC129969649 isoform X1 [Argiope bruennichi]|uniref:uncharacterized protein LOC129969649 isoform X1 n=2 Tax=Argiope bruennichi TaxID=94029 RepID=UPI0024947644|nr:uncharacterized protein LOC129969649 isoform X1 [Argiope bruennichi]